MLILLICGVVAVAALLGAFFLARGEGDKEEQGTAAQSDALTEKSSASAEAPKSLPAPASESSAVESSAADRTFSSQSQVSQPLLTGQRSLPSQPQVTRQFPREGFHTTSELPSSLPLSNGQVSASYAYNRYENDDVTAVSRHLYELAGQVQILQRQSQEIEHSLAQLSGVVERLQQRQVHEARNAAAAEDATYVQSQPYGEAHF